MARTFAARVARATVLAATVSAAFTATVSGALSARGALQREDARLGAAADTLIRELGADPRQAAHEADEEAVEVAPAGLKIALWEGGRRQGGARELPPPSGPGCVSVSFDGARWRRCALRYGARVVVVASPLAPLEQARRAGVLASLAAVAAAALVALAVGRRASAHIVAPLEGLRGAVAGVRADAPDPQVLGAPVGYDEVDALRSALASLLTEHAEALARSRRFAADAAHELRTPLTIAQGELELLLEGAGLSPAVDASLGRVQRTLKGLTALAERLLILAAPLDRSGVCVEAVSLAEVVASSRASLAAANRARVHVVADEDALVRGDAMLLKTLVDNALDNALKFAPEGLVRVRVDAARGAVVLRVSDEGVGLGAAERVRVFEPFYRTAAARAGSARGHGVGLALIAHVARAHGGAVCFEDVAKGASLCVTLPVWRDAEGRPSAGP
ncbi:MAG: HAMP domain-containing histidine kinase [Myxococcales bacterium]|nr:HAMP domain-containing histidine kinase [Myxococcales bacterium]